MNIKNILLGGLLCTSGLYSMTSQATCTFLSGSAADSEVVRFGNATIQRDAPVGSVVATVTATTFANRGSFLQCDTPGAILLTSRWSAEGTSPVTFNGEQLFNVGVAGLAMRVITPSGIYGWPYTGNFSRDLQTPGCSWPGPITWRRYCGATWGGATRFELVKIANTTGSGTLSIPGRIRASIVGQTYVYAFSFGASSVSTVACSVTNTTINVPMGNVKRKTFTGVGYQSTPVIFNILANCDAGTRVNYRIDATADSSGLPGVIAIDSPTTGTAASGVGIALTESGKPVALGTTIPYRISAGGVLVIQFSARYYQTTPKVTAGTANATATFTMTYN
ncbi:fimbrial protein [Pseudomonas sp.]|uniref:fimbrial protein n=1 Tax=Pseudomonas sp. TaxID=306 RepID=UPI003D6EDACC